MVEAPSASERGIGDGSCPFGCLRHSLREHAGDIIEYQRISRIRRPNKRRYADSGTRG